MCFLSLCDTDFNSTSSLHSGDRTWEKEKSIFARGCPWQQDSLKESTHLSLRWMSLWAEVSWLVLLTKYCSECSVSSCCPWSSNSIRLMNYHGMLTCRAQEEGKGLAWDVCTSGRKRVEWLDSACYTSWGAHSQRRLQTTWRENPIQLHRQVASCGGEEPEVFSLIVCQWQNQPLLLEYPTSTVTRKMLTDASRAMSVETLHQNREQTWGNNQCSEITEILRTY